MKDNFYYFNISKANHEKPFDDFYMFLRQDANLDKYVAITKEIKDIITTINQLNKNEGDSSKFYTILKHLLIGSYSNNSEFACFINATGITLDYIKNADDDSFKKLVSLYLNHRSMTDLTPKEWLQALIDKGSSRKNGKSGERKILNIAQKNKFIAVDNWNDFNNTEKAIAFFSSSENSFNIDTINSNLGINLDFNNQGKLLDVLIKSNTRYTLIEAKHMKDGGGSQNKQIVELIDIIKLKAPESFHFGAFLDGIYSNKLLNHTGNDNKFAKQLSDIHKALSENPSNFWFNTAGIEAFLSDF